METAVLAAVGAGPIDTHTYATSAGIDHQAVIGVVRSLEGDSFVELEAVSRNTLALTAGGVECAKEGSPEYRCLQLLPAVGLSLIHI